MDISKNYFDDDNPRYRLSDFDYKLPEKLIAQYPLEERDKCRLMVLNRETRDIQHLIFRDIVEFFQPGDCLVLNNTRVFSARLLGKKDKTGAKVEVFLLRNLENGIWEVMVKPARKVRLGNKIIFSDTFYCDIIDNTVSGGRIIEIHCNGDFLEELDKVGKTPLPPYIKREAEEKDKQYYQTVYAKETGAVAAPTAGLHFTEELLEQIRNKGVKIAFLTLHVGLGTFRPVQVDDISRHQMHSEYYKVPEEAAHIINETREQGKDIFAVGTTCVRVLETVADRNGKMRACEGWTDKFIYPPYQFRMVDHLITNFHLPQSTLLMLTSAFAGHEFLMEAYKVAVKEKYRFFSYGDSMLIL
ncbi:MAG: tRNA preQ1(34) S-adenosylmethionine ribosyltransferase-isomerase QueA [Calditrichaeota bacterium]|nr:MAG: tRNA preQ1(34) S-adenosylmethionine ribosyltransferase-isomerase QueA [Calditrichota bacterium]